MGPAGEARDASVWSLLGYTQGHAKPPYASQPFGDTPQETFERGRAQRGAGFRAVRFGWGLIAHGGRAQDADHIVAARDGIGPEGVLLVDTGRIFGEDVDAASAGLPVLQAAATWLEEPFAAHAHDAHAALARQCRTVRFAGSEGAHNAFMARHLLEHGRVGFIQIDCGRIGGIGPAKQVAEHAVARAATHVNHTFTSPLALPASLRPFAGLRSHRLCEFPAHPKPLATAFTDLPRSFRSKLS